MPKLDAAMVQKITRDLERLSPDTKPLWGTLTAPTMLGHLQGVVFYTMGQGAEMPFKGNAVSRHVFRPLILSGLVKIPHNIRVPRQKDGTPVPMPSIELPALVETMEAYVAAAGNNPARTHPFFGILSEAEWQKFHVSHFKHHMTQFGVWS